MPTSTQCLECRHYTGLSTCEAYPEGIPQEIFTGIVDHTERYPGDMGFMWEPSENAEITKDEKKVRVKGHSTKKGYVKEYYRTVSSTEKIKPKTPVGMTVEEFKKNPIEGFVYDPKLDDEEVRARRHGGKTYLSTAWFGFNEGHQKRLLFHEMGHDLCRHDDYNVYYEDVLVRKEGKDYLGAYKHKNWFGGSSRAEEIVADTYAALRTGGWKEDVSEKTVEAGRLLLRVVEVAKKRDLPLPKDINNQLDKYFIGDIDIPRKKKFKPKSIRDGTGKIAHLPDNIRNEILTLHKFGNTPERIKSDIENMIEASAEYDDDLKNRLVVADVIKSLTGKVSLNIASVEMVNWAELVQESEKVTKFEIPDEILEEAGIDPKKMSPDQLKAMFAQMKEAGLLKPKAGEGKGATPSGETDSSHPGLVKKKVMAKGKDGKMYETTKWVKPGEDVPEEKVPKPKPEKPTLIIRGLNTPEGEEEEPEKEEPKEEKPKKEKPKKEEPKKEEPKEDWDESEFEEPPPEEEKPKAKKPKKESKKESKKPKGKREKFEMSEHLMTNELDAMEAGLPESSHGFNLSLCEFEGGHRAIYKPAESEEDKLNIVGETGYHDLAEAIGWDMVPQTEEVDLGGGPGSCQAFIEGEHPKWSKKNPEGVTIKAKHFEELAQIFVMDLLVGNGDRHNENIIIDKDDNVWAIDNDTWTQNAPDYSPDDMSESLLALKYHVEGADPTKGKEDKGYNKLVNCLAASISQRGFKKFESIMKNKLAEVLKEEDTIRAYYPNTGTRKGSIDANIEEAKKYLAEQK